MSSSMRVDVAGVEEDGRGGAAAEETEVSIEVISQRMTAKTYFLE
jgi:hypothetical protein